MSNEKGTGERTAQLAALAAKAAKIARAATVGGPKVAAAETVRQFLPHILKAAAAILIVITVVPMLIFSAVPHFLFGWADSLFGDVQNMTQLAEEAEKIYGRYDDMVREETEKLKAQLLSGYDEDSAYDIFVSSNAGNTSVLWFIAIMSAHHQQDLEVINESTIRQLVTDNLRGTVTVSYNEDDEISSVTINIKDMNPNELMASLNFTDEQRNWATLIYNTMTGDEINEFDFLNESSTDRNYWSDFGDAGSPMGDGSYEALIAEAEKHLGKPYVFGASGPDAFDCSSYVSYVLYHSGAANFGRLTAQGLFNKCTPIQASEAMPGDLVFFTGTYNAGRPVTHVGIFVGEVNQRPSMIHAGKPVQYAPIDTAYWKKHFFSYGRLKPD